MAFMSPDEIADDMMLYRLTSLALVEIRKHTLQDMLGLVSAEIGHNIRASYGLWDVNNPYTASSFDPSVHDTVDDNPKHPHNVTRQILTIVWRRLQ